MNLRQWILEHVRLTAVVGLATAITALYVIRKAGVDAFSFLRSIRHSHVEKKLLTVLSDSDRWQSNPSTGAGERLVRAGQLAQALSLREETVADSLERLEHKSKVKRHDGTLDNSSPYWSVIRRW